MPVAELLAPAGTLRNLHHALAYGADAVYAGVPRYSLRVRNNDFDLANLALGIEAAHRAGRKLFLAANLLPHDAKVKTFMADLEEVVALAPDALIMADPGLIMQVRERWPQMPIHLSVQANTMNHAAVRFWASVGVSRVILSRELSLDEVASIRQACPDTELEVFVHGALCIAYSGRCLLSGYFNHRDANQGACTNACRWEYKVGPSNEAGGSITPAACGGVERHPQAQGEWLLEEAGRPGEAMPVEEDEHGTYILNSRDLRAVEHIGRLVAIGVDSLKIEGRTKSHYYVARTVQIYRQAIDDAVAGRPFDTTLLGRLEGLAHRGYTDGFYQRHHSHEYQNYMEGCSQSGQQQFVAEITAYDDSQGLAWLEVKNRFSVGDTLELIVPHGNRRFRVAELYAQDGSRIEVAPGSGHRVALPLPPADYRYALLARDL